MSDPEDQKVAFDAYWLKADEELFKSLISLPLESCRSLASDTITVASLYGVWIGFFSKESLLQFELQLIAMIPLVFFAIATH